MYDAIAINVIDLVITICVNLSIVQEFVSTGNRRRSQAVDHCHSHSTVIHSRHWSCWGWWESSRQVHSCFFAVTCYLLKATMILDLSQVIGHTGTMHGMQE